MKQVCIFLLHSDMIFHIDFVFFLLVIGQLSGILEVFFAIYFRPTDSHCIYIDKKAKGYVKAAIQGLVKCYKRKFFDSDEEGSKHIFIYENSDHTFWGHISILNADLACLRHLHFNDRNSQVGWKYFFNLAGSELPLKSEERAREILKGLKGDDGIIGGYQMPMTNLYRLKNPFYMKW